MLDEHYQRIRQLYRYNFSWLIVNEVIYAMNIIYTTLVETNKKSRIANSTVRWPIKMNRNDRLYNSKNGYGRPKK